MKIMIKRKLQGKNQMMTMVKKQDGKSDDNGEEAELRMALVKKQMKIKVLKLLHKSDDETGEETNENKIIKAYA